ncbi:MAG TPA: ATP-binding protein [Erysipelotrichaceae bacterium]|nr:ATP-binding protein [Erysipelotrichaceae bacterium]
MNKSNYKPRIVDSLIEKNLRIFGALCIEGPKWCGKTWTSLYHARSAFFVGNPEGNFSNRMLAETEPYTVLQGDTPRLIDEWQEVPSLWDAVRFFVDESGKKGQIILTGSSTPIKKGVLHSGTGRIKSIRMNTMSLYESGDSSGLISLKDLCENKFESKLLEETSLSRLAYLIVRGGWPGNIETSELDGGNLAISYMENVAKLDLGELDKDIDYNEHKAKLILKSLARNEATTVSNQSILRDIIENDVESISKNTLTKYLNAFDRMFLFNNQEPFSPSIRSSLRVKQMEKRHFSDPAMACALLKLTPKKMMNDLKTFSFMFEALVERDLSIYAQAMNAKLFHYQDYKGNEIDAVIELDDGNWCAFEIKLGLNKAEEGASNLIKVCQDVVNNGGKEPLLKCVIYGVGNMAYKNTDGVYIIPITSLKD